MTTCRTTNTMTDISSYHLPSFKLFHQSPSSNLFRLLDPKQSPNQVRLKPISTSSFTTGRQQITPLRQHNEIELRGWPQHPSTPTHPPPRPDHGSEAEEAGHIREAAEVDKGG